MTRALFVVALVACKDKPHDTPVPAKATDARVADAAPIAWPELEDYPRVEPVRVIPIPVRLDVPRFEVGGPILVDDLAIVSSSQLGFAAIDWRQGKVSWTKPSGEHVAPPARWGDDLVLIGSCLNPPVVAPDEHLLGCLRVVTLQGSDEAYLAIRGRGVDDFVASAGEQSVWTEPHAIRWRRGEAAVTIDPLTGIAKPASAAAPPLVAESRGKRWEIEQIDGKIVAKGSKPWRTENEYAAMLGLVHLPDHSPMLRVARAGMFGTQSEINVFDIDATGSLHAASARPSPGISLLGWGTSPVGDAALAVRLDTSLRRDFIAAYAASAHLVWVWPLPEMQRADPVGVAIARDAVVVFHDGDTLTVLPELWVPPTAPGAARQNPTP